MSEADRFSGSPAVTAEFAAASSAEIAAERAYEAFYEASGLETSSRSDADHDALQSRFDDLVDEQRDALLRMLRTPAPNMASLIHKMERINAAEGFGVKHCNPEDDVFDELLADLRRLAMTEVAHV